MEIKKVGIESIKAYEFNAKEHPKEQIEQIKQSIRDFGNCDPIAVDEDGVIIEGHGRYIALTELGYKEVEIIRLEHLTDEQKKAYRLVHNKLTMNSDFDFAILERELAALNDINMEDFGFDFTEFENAFEEPNLAEEFDEARPSLQERYIIPPFSVFDTKQGYWKDRKEMWKKFIKSGEGRETDLIGGFGQLAQKHGQNLTGTSIFDPVLCEVLINWFCPQGGKIIDPFAGGSVRGLISVLLGNEYTGIDLSEKQIKANIKNYKAIADRQDLNGDDLRQPNWINDDSRNIDLLVKGKHDFLLTCPPYADLEVYSDDPRDISNMSYPEFREAYFEIIKKACDKLKDNAFAAIVIGEVRDKKGYYYDFVGDTVEAFKAAGLEYYNECILLNAISTAALRVERQFSASRKVVKTHQNVLIFVKGNEREITQRLGSYEYDFNEPIEND